MCEGIQVLFHHCWCFTATLPSTGAVVVITTHCRNVLQRLSAASWLPVSVDTSWHICCPRSSRPLRSSRPPGEARRRDGGATSRVPGTSACPSWREKAGGEARWACGGQEGAAERGAAAAEGGAAARWDSLTGIRGLTGQPGDPLCNGRPLVAQGEGAGVHSVQCGHWQREGLAYEKRNHKEE